MAGMEVGWGGMFVNGDVFPVVSPLAADETVPEVGVTIPEGSQDTYLGFNIFQADSSTYGEYLTSW